MKSKLNRSILVHWCPGHSVGVHDLYLGFYTLTPKIIQIRMRRMIPGVEKLFRYKHDVYQAVVFLPSGVKVEGEASWDIRASDLRWSDIGCHISGIFSWDVTKDSPN